MSGQPKTTKSVFIPAPIDGLNLIANPAQLLATEARDLRNYLCYPWGIRERSADETIVSNAVPTIGYGELWSAQNTSGVRRLFLTYNDSGTGYIKRLDSTADTTFTDVTGSTDFASNGTVVKHAFEFNGKLWFIPYNGVPAEYDLDTEGNCVDMSFTGPVSLTHIGHGFNFKSRVYLIQDDLSGDSCSVWYGGVDAITGPLTKVDFRSIFEHPGKIAYGFSWGYNQGTENSELFCLLSTSGELLVYSGDYPAATNWSLLARLQLPELQANNVRYPYVAKIGQEVLVPTSQGVINLSQVLAGTQANISYIKPTMKLGIAANSLVALKYESSLPFLFAAPNYEIGYLPARQGYFAQNIETGAWSAILHTDSVYDIQPYYECLYALQGRDLVRITFNISDNPAGSNAMDWHLAPVWKTPFFDFGTHTEKASRMLRVVGQDLSTDYDLRVSCYIKTNFKDDTNIGAISAREEALAVGVTGVAEVSPPGIGRRLSYCLYKLPTGERNELYGFEAVFEEGGRY